MIFNRVYNLRIMNTDLNIIHEIFRALILFKGKKLKITVKEVG